MLKRKSFNAPLFLVLAVIAIKICAGTQVHVGQQQLRHHLQALADAGIVKTPVNTWPLNWSNIIRDIEKAEQRGDFNDSLQWSVRYVSFEGKKQTQNVNAVLRNSMFSSPVPISDYSTRVRSEDTLSGRAEFIAGLFAIDAEVTYVSDPIDGDEFRLDGSSAAVIIDNWVLGLGAIDRWWGPGWQSSLILSNNARPAPGVFLRRNYDDTFSAPLLNLLGPWQLEFFVNQLEEEREVEDTRMGGARISFKPLPALEWGYSSTQLVDTENKLHRDSVGWSQHLSAVDFRGSFSFGGLIHGMYAQIAGEAEGDFLPENNVGLVGYDLVKNLNHSSHRLVLEYSNTVVGFLDDKQFGRAYEDSVFLTGYRFEGRGLGSAFGSDVESVSVLGMHYFLNGWEFEWKANLITNKNEIGADESNDFFQFRVGKILGDNLKAVATVYAFSDPFILEEGDTVSEGGGLSLIYRY